MDFGGKYFKAEKCRIKKKRNLKDEVPSDEFKLAVALKKDTVRNVAGNLTEFVSCLQRYLTEREPNRNFSAVGTYMIQPYKGIILPFNSQKCYAVEDYDAHPQFDFVALNNDSIVRLQRIFTYAVSPTETLQLAYVQKFQLAQKFPEVMSTAYIPLKYELISLDQIQELMVARFYWSNREAYYINKAVDLPLIERNDSEDD